MHLLMYCTWLVLLKSDASGKKKKQSEHKEGTLCSDCEGMLLTSLFFYL